MLDPERKTSSPRPPRAPGGSRRRSAQGQPGAARSVTGPYSSAGPYEDEAGNSYDVRLERVPGGVRLAEWAGGQIRRRAPVLGATGLASLLADAREREVLRPADAEALFKAACTEPAGGDAPHGASRGRAGDMQEELRLERLDGDKLRIGRWILRPGAGWELQQAPVMLPATRYAEAIRSAAAAGLLSSSA